MQGSVNPRMITIAREARRLTQICLAGQLGVTQGRLSRMENGELPVSGEMVAALSKVLGYPEKHFYRADEYRHLPFTFRRKRIRLTNPIERSIAARVNLIRMYIGDLVKSVEMIEPRFTPIDLRASGKRPSDVAIALRAEWSVPRGPIENLTKLVEDAGVLILQWDFGTDKIDGLSIYEVDQAPPLILVNRSNPGDRQRFTLAHEFGHVVMHHNLQTPPGDDIELEANQFASELLMPATDVRAHITMRPTLETFANLKPHWKVSMGALVERAASLSRISEYQRTRLWKEMAMNGYRLREPLEIPKERPSLFEELVQVHIRDLGYSLPQLCESVLGVGVQEFTAQVFGGLYAIGSPRAAG